jgi:hypothetical protein
MRQSLSKVQWTDKEDTLILKMVEKHNKYVLDYAFQQASTKLYRTFSAIKQRYYKLLEKQNQELIKQQFVEIVTKGDFKVSKHKNKYVVIV